MLLTYKYSKEALEHVISNVLKLKIKSLIQRNLNNNYYEFIEDFVNIDDTDIRNLHYEIFTKELKNLIGYQNLIRSFIGYFNIEHLIMTLSDA